MSDKLSDQWCTPQWLFDELNKEFNFDIDLCATRENSKCIAYYEDYLSNKLVLKLTSTQTPYITAPFQDYTCFMNPPYSNPKPFIEKAWEDSKHCKIVCLVKCDPSTRWWATFWEYEQKCPDCYSTDDYGVPLIISNKCKLGCTPRRKGTYNGPKPGCDYKFFPKRIKFDPLEGLSGKSGPTFPCALVIFDRRGL